VFLFYSYISYFFFQAEDGIRDATVTGVQTCALPISPIVDFHGTADPTIKYDGDVSHGVATPPLMEWAQSRATHNRCATGPSQTQIGRASCRERVKSRGEEAVGDKKKEQKRQGTTQRV